MDSIKAFFKHSRKLNWFDKLVLVLNGIAALALLLSYFAPYANPAHFGLIAILGLAYPELMLVHIAFLIYWLIRSRPYMLITAICILAGFNILLKNWQFHFGSPPERKLDAGNIRIMSCNIHDFISPFNERGTQKKLAKLISSKQPDVIAIQEYTVNILDYKNTNRVLSDAMQAKNYYFKGYDCTDWDSTGIAIYTRYPIISRGVVPQADTKTPMQAIYIDVKYKNTMLRIYTMHLQSTHFSATEHAYLYNLRHHARLNLQELLVIYKKLKSAFVKRSYQVRAIRQHTDKCPYPYVIAGDFNDTPISFVVNDIDKNLKNAFMEQGRGLGITYYGDFPHFQIDYIFASQRFDILNYQVIREKISDHYPVMSDMKLN